MKTILIILLLTVPVLGFAKKAKPVCAYTSDPYDPKYDPNCEKTITLYCESASPACAPQEFDYIYPNGCYELKADCCILNPSYCESGGSNKPIDTWVSDNPNANTQTESGTDNPYGLKFECKDGTVLSYDANNPKSSYKRCKIHDGFASWFIPHKEPTATTTIVDTNLPPLNNNDVVPANGTATTVSDTTSNDVSNSSNYTSGGGGSSNSSDTNVLDQKSNLQMK